MRCFNNFYEQNDVISIYKYYYGKNKDGGIGGLKYVKLQFKKFLFEIVPN